MAEVLSVDECVSRLSWGPGASALWTATMEYPVPSNCQSRRTGGATRVRVCDVWGKGLEEYAGSKPVVNEPGVLDQPQQFQAVCFWAK